LTRNDIVKAAKKAEGVLAMTAHPSEVGPIPSHTTEPNSSSTAVGPPMYTNASALLNLKYIRKCKCPHQEGMTPCTSANIMLFYLHVPLAVVNLSALHSKAASHRCCNSDKFVGKKGYQLQGAHRTEPLHPRPATSGL
jgi:hypothetical protein